MIAYTLDRIDNNGNANVNHVAERNEDSEDANIMITHVSEKIPTDIETIPYSFQNNNYQKLLKYNHFPFSYVRVLCPIENTCLSCKKWRSGIRQNIFWPLIFSS